ncbi:MAG: S-layer protein [Bacilli bacterium]|nr:S-layer protein [Bacilli bacterium]
MRESSSNFVSSNSHKLKQIQGGEKKFMKKSLSLILALAMVFTMFVSVVSADTTPAAATTTATATSATYTPQQAYDALKAAGVLDGDAQKGANLDGTLTRAEFAKVIVKLWNLTGDVGASDAYSDLNGAGWAAGYIGAATTAGLLNGMGGGMFNPSGNVTTEQIAKVLAVKFDLDVSNTDVGSTKASDWAKGYVAAAIKAGYVKAGADTTKAAKRGELFVISINAYEAIPQPTATPTATPVATAKTLDVATAVAVTSKVVEVALNTAAAAADVNAKNVTVKDAAGTAVAISSAVAAPYATDGKTVLVTLGTDTTAGTLYTLTSGTTSANFGGISVDTAKPTVSIVSTDYNKVVLTFSERVDITKLKVVLSLKYGTKAALAISNTAYVAGDGTKVELTTADQTGDLYASDISGAADFAGNVVDQITSLTFVGTLKDITTTLQPAAAPLTKTVDSKTVRLVFNVKPDASTIAAVANYTLKEAYGTTPAQTTVASVKAAVDADFPEYTTAQLASNGYTAKAVILTLSTALKDSTLYKLTVSGLKTYTGVAVDGTANYVTFVGIGPYTTLQDLSKSTITVLSNTKVKIVFNRTLDQSTLVAANFKIAKTYGDKSALAVSAIKIDSGTTVELTTASQTNDLYTVTVSNIKDMDGNLFDSALATKTFVGSAVASAIAAIKSATLSTDHVTLSLVFDQNVAASAADISHYNINKSIGYPTKAVINADHANQVDLTIPATTVIGTLYTVSVTNLDNTDGIHQGSTAITGQFVGNAVTASLPTAQGVQATDSQTLKVFFDKAVDDGTIDGATALYDHTVASPTNNIVSGAFTLTTTSGNVDLHSISGAYAYKDPTNANALVISVPIAGYFKVANAPASSGLFTLTIDSAKVVSTSSANILTVGPTVTDIAGITADNVTSPNANTIRVYFSKPVVVGGASSFAQVGTTNVWGASGNFTLSNATAIDTTNTVFDFKVVGGSFTDNSIKYLIINPSVSTGMISDLGHSISMKDEDTSASLVQQTRQFGGNSAAAGTISSIQVQPIDTKTLVVYYPEVMNTTAGDNTDVTVKGNYELASASGTSGATITGAGWSSLASHISSTSYEAGTNKLTITLDAAIPTSSTGNYYLRFASSLMNAVGTKPVVTSTTDATLITTQFGPNPKAAALVTVTGATYASPGVITITLNQKAQDTVGNLTATNVTYEFNVTVKVNGVDHLLVAGDISSVKTYDSSVINHPATDMSAAGYNSNTVEITLNAGLASTITHTQVGTVNFYSTNHIIGINGEKYDSNSSTQFSQ